MVGASDLQAKLDEAEAKLAELDPEDEEFYDLIDLMGGWKLNWPVSSPKNELKDRKGSHGMAFPRRISTGQWGSFLVVGKCVSLGEVTPSGTISIDFDEPTNHLDVVSQNWLEHYLKGYQGSILVISHDRAFLETVTERTIELKLGTLNSYKEITPLSQGKCCPFGKTAKGI